MTPKKNTLPPLEETIAKAQKMVTEPITSSSMSPASPVQITPPTPGTQATSMLGEIQSSTDANNDAFQRSLQQDTDRKETNYLGSSKAYFDMLNSIRGEASLTSEAYAQEGGVDTVQTELNDINQQIRNEQRALDNTVRNLEEKGGGLQGGMQAEINNARRQSLRTQADLYVIQQGVQGKYDSAKAIADRAVSAYLEDQRLELDALKFNYDENKDLFTTAEQREFDVNFDTRKRALDKEESNLKNVYTLGIDAQQNGAPKEIAEQMLKAKTPQEAIAIGGEYIGRIQRLQAMASIENARIGRLIQLAELGQPAAYEALGIKAPDGSTPSSDLLAYAQQYASTGKIPTGMPKNISFGQVSELAKDLPKPKGTLVSTNTGVIDQSLGVDEQGDLKRLYNILEMTKELEEADKKRFGGVIAGTLGKVAGSQAQGTYLKIRKSIVDELARMQTGAALTKDEQTFYEDYLPGRLAEPFFLGQDSEDVIADFKKVMETKLNNALANNQMTIYGYSKIGEHTVGDVLTNANGQRGILNADGTITPVE